MVWIKSPFASYKINSTVKLYVDKVGPLSVQVQLLNWQELSLQLAPQSVKQVELHPPQVMMPQSPQSFVQPFPQIQLKKSQSELQLNCLSHWLNWSSHVSHPICPQAQESTLHEKHPLIANAPQITPTRRISIPTFLRNKKYSNRSNISTRSRFLDIWGFLSVLKQIAQIIFPFIQWTTRKW